MKNGTSDVELSLQLTSSWKNMTHAKLRHGKWEEETFHVV